MKTLMKKAVVMLAGSTLVMGIDHFVPRKTATNPTVTRLLVVLAAFGAWEFVEPAIERHLGLTAKK